jgi:hypothetical protein
MLNLFIGSIKGALYPSGGWFDNQVDKSVILSDFSKLVIRDLNQCTVISDSMIALGINSKGEDGLMTPYELSGEVKALLVLMYTDMIVDLASISGRSLPYIGEISRVRNATVCTNEARTLIDGENITELHVLNDDSYITSQEELNKKFIKLLGRGAGFKKTSVDGVRLDSPCPVLVQSRFVRYRFNVNSKYTVLYGDSSDAYNPISLLVSGRGVSVDCSLPVKPVLFDSWKGIFQKWSGVIFLIDDRTEGYLSRKFAEAVEASNNYFVFITRKSLDYIPYGAEDVYCPDFSYRDDGPIEHSEITYRSLRDIK